MLSTFRSTLEYLGISRGDVPRLLAGRRELYYARPPWRQYLAALEKLADRRGIRVIDASNWMPSQNDFVDHLHMTQQAAHDFSVRLGTS
jgi:hypothetical protein